MIKKRILIFGDSHTDSIKRALKIRRTKSEYLIEAYRYGGMKNGKKIGDVSEEEILERVKQLTSDDIVVTSVGGNQHQVLSLIQHPRKFDMYASSDEIIDRTNLEIIPYAQLSDTFESGIRGKDGKRIKAIKDVANCNVYHIIAPPPKEDEAHILRKHETHFVDAGISEMGITKSSLRLKMWKLQIKTLEKLSKEWGVNLIYTPENTLTDTEFLKPEYYANDATHANEKYGELILQQLEKVISENLDKGKK